MYRCVRDRRYKYQRTHLHTRYRMCMCAHVCAYLHTRYRMCMCAHVCARTYTFCSECEANVYTDVYNICLVHTCTCMVFNNTYECMLTLHKNAYGLVHARLCNGTEASLPRPWKIFDRRNNVDVVCVFSIFNAGESVWGRVCLHTHAHTHTAQMGYLDVSARSRDETPGGPEESRWTKSWIYSYMCTNYSCVCIC